MKRQTWSFFLVLSAAVPAIAGSNPAGQDLLTRAAQQANLFNPEVSPFQLDVDFVIQKQAPIEGHLIWKWQANDRWWRSIGVGDFRQIDIRNGDKLFTSRNLPYTHTPLRILELLQLLQFGGPEGMQARKQKDRTENGVALTCLNAQSDTSQDKSHWICVNPSSYEILSSEWKDSPDGLQKEEYSNYFKFRAHRYPRQLQLFLDGNKTITAHVVNLATAPVEDTLLVPPQGSIERRQCAGMRRAVPIKTPDPAYPTSAKDQHVVGNTTVSITVLPNGSVGSVRLLGSSDQSLDEATMKTLQGWKFKPAMCGTEPIESDLEVKVSFKLF
jgi:TonB family protein